MSSSLSLVVAGGGYSLLQVHKLLTMVASFVAEDRLQSLRAQQLYCTGLAAPWHVEPSQTRDRTHVCGIGRWRLNHCPAREVLLLQFRSSSAEVSEAPKRHTIPGFAHAVPSPSLALGQTPFMFPCFCSCPPAL